jgi:hypothetical protein
MHRGVACAAVGACSPGGPTGCYAASSAVCRGVALGARGGDTKTMKSRRTIALPDLCVRALVTLRAQQDTERRAAGEQWHETGLVFTTRLGTAMMPRMCAGTSAEPWRQFLASSPTSGRHVSLGIHSSRCSQTRACRSKMCPGSWGHCSTSVTELVYRHQIRPVIQSGATIMDRLFSSPADRRAAEAVATDNRVEGSSDAWRAQ